MSVLFAEIQVSYFVKNTTGSRER